MSRPLRCDICDVKIDHKVGWEHVGQYRPTKRWWQVWQEPGIAIRKVFWRDGRGYDFSNHDVCIKCWPLVKEAILGLRAAYECGACGALVLEEDKKDD